MKMGKWAMAKTEDPTKLEALRSAASVDARGSPLYRWMWDNYEEFSDIVSVRRPNWRGITDFFISQGFVSADGKELRPNSVVQTWERVKRRREPRKPRKKSKPAEIKTDTVTEVVRVSSVVPVNMPSNRTSPRVGSDNQRDELNDPDAVMRALDEQLNAGRPKMPKPIK